MTHTNFSALPCVQAPSDSVHSDVRLVNAAKAGSTAAFSELHSLYKQRICRTTFLITRNQEDAEDAMQDAFMRAYLAIRTFEGKAAFYTWLRRIAINSALMVLRKQRVRRELLNDVPCDSYEETPPFEFKDTSLDPEQSYQHKQQQGNLIKAIQSLKPRLRNVVEEQLMQDGSMRDIARTLNISEAAVKSRLSRARRRLRAAPEFEVFSDSYSRYAKESNCAEPKKPPIKRSLY